MFGDRRFQVVGVSLAAGAAVLAPALRAQCADGTPPPCEVRAHQVVARAAAPAAPADRGRRFLVLPFRNITRAPDYEWLVEGSPSLVADALGQWQDVYVVPPERLYPALRRHGLVPGQVMDEDKVRRVAEETGGWTAVAGDVLATGNRIQVTARVYDVVSGQVVVRAREEVAAQVDIREAYDRLAGRLLQVAGLEVETPRLAGVTTQSLEAYKAYQNGLAYYDGYQLAKARAEFQRAIQLDSTFAQAYMKLAKASMTTADVMTNPQSQMYRYAEKALALSSRLPPRDRGLVQAMSDLFHGQLTSGRERLEGLVAADSNDVEALQQLADIEMIDPILVERNGALRPRGDRNRAARLAKRVLGLDPQQHSMYNNLAVLYGIAGGLNHGAVPGLKKDPPSLLALGVGLGAQPDTLFAALLRDSLEVLPVDEFERLPPGQLEEGRRRARDIAVAWVERWLAVAPEEGLAHLSAAAVFALAGQYDRALAQVAQAESLGVEFKFLADFPGRRLQILMQAARYPDALTLADSLKRASYFGGMGALTNPLGQIDAGWAFNLYLMRNRFAAAESLVTGLMQPLAMMARLDSGQAVNSVLTIFALRSGPRTPPALPDIPNGIRDAALDSLLAHLAEFSGTSPLRSRLGTLMSVTYQGMLPDRARDVAARRRRLADQWATGGSADLAYQVLYGVDGLDTSAAVQDSVLDAYARLARQDPPGVRALYRLGRLAAISGRQLEEGEQAFQAYLGQPAPRGEPTHADANWRLGQIYEKMGKRDLARARYEKALELNPAHPQAKLSLDALLRSQPPR